MDLFLTSVGGGGYTKYPCLSFFLDAFLRWDGGGGPHGDVGNLVDCLELAAAGGLLLQHPGPIEVVILGGAAGIAKDVGTFLDEKIKSGKWEGEEKLQL